MARKSAAANMFDSAQVVEIKSPVAEKATASKTKNIEMGDKLDYLAAINALSSSLETVQKVYYKEVTEAMSEEFVNESMRTQKRAPNFKGIGPNSEASCEMRKRSSRSYLNDEEIAILKANNISMVEEVLSEEIPERFFFNPDLLSDSKIASLISEKLAEIPELEGKQVIMKQAKREKVVKNCVSEDSFDEISKLSDKELVAQLIGIVSTLGVKSKLNTQDINVVLDLVRKSGVKL